MGVFLIHSALELSVPEPEDVIICSHAASSLVQVKTRSITSKTTLWMLVGESVVRVKHVPFLQHRAMMGTSLFECSDEDVGNF